VDDEQVDLVDAQRLQGAVEGPEGVVATVVAIVQLAGDEDLVSGQSGRGHCGADALLVAIHLRRVDVR
jgi:hypothetical protein